MARKKTAEQIIRSAQVRENRAYYADIRRIKRAIAGAKFYGWEMEEIKRLVFGAYGRTKLSG